MIEVACLYSGQILELQPLEEGKSSSCVNVRTTQTDNRVTWSNDTSAIRLFQTVLLLQTAMQCASL